MAKKEKTYNFEINLKFSQLVSAKSKTEAEEMVKASFSEDYGIDLEENEYKLVK